MRVRQGMGVERETLWDWCSQSEGVCAGESKGCCGCGGSMIKRCGGQGGGGAGGSRDLLSRGREGSQGHYSMLG